MANATGKHIDKTFLSINQAEERGFIHRDYIAHCLRWSHVIKYMSEGQKYKHAQVLDVGCGREAPMATMLHSSRMAPAGYIGIDYGPIDRHAEFKGAFKPQFIPNSDFADTEFDKKFDVITCFEVLEHVEPDHSKRILEGIRDHLLVDGCAFLSTPCWNKVDCAANHVNEMTYEALGAMIEDSELEVLKTYGTFASMRDYVHRMTKEQSSVFEGLREYYDVNVISCLFAPLFPEYSRNALWVVKKSTNNTTRRFKCLSEVKAPWSSSQVKAPWSSSQVNK